MQQSEVARYLVRAVLDEDFRDLARTDPEASFDGFALSPVERDILTRQNADMLRLIAYALPEATAPEQPAAEPASRPTIETPLPVTGAVLEPVDLVLQLIAVPSRTDDGTLKVPHYVTLHPAPAPGAGWPPVPEGLPPGAAAPIHLRVTVAPHATRLPDGLLGLTYAAGVRMEQAEVAAPAAVPTEGAGSSPWHHRVDSPEAVSAAAAVKTAPAAERYDRLLELVAALTGVQEAP